MEAGHRQGPGMDAGAHPLAAALTLLSGLMAGSAEARLPPQPNQQVLHLFLSTSVAGK